MENSTTEYPTPRTEYIEARKVSMSTLEAKPAPLVQETTLAVEEEESDLLGIDKDYIPTSNLLQVRNVAFATFEEEKPTKEEAEEQRNEHTLFYGDVMDGKATVDRTKIEKKIDKQG